MKKAFALFLLVCGLVWGALGNQAGWAQAVMVKDLCPGSDGSTPSSFMSANDQFVYFVATDGTHGNELWRSDGAAEGTTMLKDIYDGNSVSDPTPQELVMMGSNVYFFATDAANGRALWTSDGTPGGTAVLFDCTTETAWDWIYPDGLMTTGERLYFRGFDETYDREPWISDGTAGGTHLLADLGDGVIGSSPNGFTTFKDKVYFSASLFDVGLELYYTDGTEGGTDLFMDIQPGTMGSTPQHFTAVGDLMFFAVAWGNYTDGFDQQLWCTDGTVGGTRMLAGGFELLNNLIEFKGALYFGAHNTTYGYELWRSDGTAEGTVLVKDIRANGSDGLYTGFGTERTFMTAGDTLYFRANDGSTGIELWRSDGTAGGTVQVKDIREGALGSTPVLMDSKGSWLFFAAADLAHGMELWKTDGTAGGTSLVQDIWPGSGGAIGQGAFVGNNFYFAASDGTNGLELWMIGNAVPVENGAGHWTAYR